MWIFGQHFGIYMSAMKLVLWKMIFLIKSSLNFKQFDKVYFLMKKLFQGLLW